MSLLLLKIDMRSKCISVQLGTDMQVSKGSKPRAEEDNQRTIQCRELSENSKSQCRIAMSTE